MHSYIFRFGPLLLAVVVMSACSTMPEIVMNSTREMIDDSVVSKKLKADDFKRVMVIPPSGTVRGAYDTVIALFEKEFLRNGITVISGAITGRVILENSRGKASAAGITLSDAERALVMAKKSGADAILQIGAWKWTSTESSRRYFISMESGISEVGRKEYIAFKGYKIAFSSTELSFVGRLTNVQNGEVMAAFEIRSPANYNLPSRYVASVSFGDAPHMVIESENFSYAGKDWLNEAQRTTEALVIARVGKLIQKKLDPPPAVAAKSEPTPVKAEEAKASESETAEATAPESE